MTGHAYAERRHSARRSSMTRGALEFSNEQRGAIRCADRRASNSTHQHGDTGCISDHYVWPRRAAPCPPAITGEVRRSAQRRCAQRRCAQRRGTTAAKKDLDAHILIFLHRDTVLNVIEMHDRVARWLDRSAGLGRVEYDPVFSNIIYF